MFSAHQPTLVPTTPVQVASSVPMVAALASAHFLVVAIALHLLIALLE